MEQASLGNLLFLAGALGLAVGFLIGAFVASLDR